MSIVRWFDAQEVWIGTTITIQRQHSIKTGDWLKFWAGEGGFDYHIGKAIVTALGISDIEIFGEMHKKPPEFHTSEWLDFWFDRQRAGMNSNYKSPHKG